MRVSNHLPHCKQRQGRDYTNFLAKRSGTTGKGRGVCPKCGYRFQCLDTHLRVSARCREITSRRLYPASPSPCEATNCAHATMNINSTPPASLTTAHASKRPLKLPRRPEEWVEADCLLQAVVVPAVLQANSAEAKNVLLSERTYELLAAQFGTYPPSRAQRRLQANLKRHDCALKEVTKSKNAARQALRRARRGGENDSVVRSLVAKFLSLVRTHSRLKKASSRKLQHAEAKIAREKCHKKLP